MTYALALQENNIDQYMREVRRYSLITREEEFDLAVAYRDNNDDICPNDAHNDVDDDLLCGNVDPCPYDTLNDADGDGLCADVDPCPYDAQNDENNNGICDVDEISGCMEVDACNYNADEIECRDELCVRMADGWLYVPLVALRDTQQPEGGDPSERRTVPGGGEYWSDADSDDEQRKPSVQRRSSPSQGAPVKGRGRSDGKLTAAAVTEADELDFYAELLKAGPARPAVPPRAVLVLVAPLFIVGLSVNPRFR